VQGYQETEKPVVTVIRYHKDQQDQPSMAVEGEQAPKLLVEDLVLTVWVVIIAETYTVADLLEVAVEVAAATA
jgi:hypothetical protein